MQTSSMAIGDQRVRDWWKAGATTSFCRTSMRACSGMDVTKQESIDRYRGASRASPCITGKQPRQPRSRGPVRCSIPHYVLSNTLTSANWPLTRFLRGLDEVASLKNEPGKDIYLIGGARTTTSLIDAGLVDELRLHVHPLIAGEGKALFETAQSRRGLTLRSVQQLEDGRVSLIYGIG